MWAGVEIIAVRNFSFHNSRSTDCCLDVRRIKRRRLIDPGDMWRGGPFAWGPPSGQLRPVGPRKRSGANGLQKAGKDLVNILQSNREIRLHEENRETGAKAR